MKKYKIHEIVYINTVNSFILFIEDNDYIKYLEWDEILYGEYIGKCGIHKNVEVGALSKKERVIGRYAAIRRY